MSEQCPEDGIGGCGHGECGKAWYSWPGKMYGVYLTTRNGGKLWYCSRRCALLDVTADDIEREFLEPR